MGKKIDKIKAKIGIALDSLFHGMAVAENELVGQKTAATTGVEAVKHIGGDTAMGDFLNQRETKRVAEMRDKYYRILREADKYVTKDSINMSFNEKGEPVFTLTKDHLSKKTVVDFMKHAPVYEEEGYTLKTIQDNKTFSKTSMFAPDLENVSTGVYDYNTTLKLDYDGISPRFNLDKFVTRMVVRNNKDNQERTRVDLYIPSMASQFGKIDAILISKIYKMFETKDYRADFVSFSKIEWFSDKGWNADEASQFTYDDPHLVDIVIFDGSFVLSFDCHIIKNGKDLAEKYRTKELDEKYATEAPKKDKIDVYTLQRKVERDKLKNKENKEKENENSN